MPDNTDAPKLSRLLVPAVTPAEVRRTLRLLTERGFVEQDDQGRHRQTSPFIRAGGPVRDIAIVNFQRAMLDIAAQARDHIPEREIDMSTITFTMSENLVAAIRREITKFKEKILGMVAREQADPNRVYHVNIDFFPVSKTATKEGR